LPARPTQALTQRSSRPCRLSVSRLDVSARTGEVGVGIFGTKAGMTQIFTADGLAVPVTVIALEEGNLVTQVWRPPLPPFEAPEKILEAEVSS
jgi:hypothetical protein